MHTQYSCNLFSGSDSIITNMVIPVAFKKRRNQKGHKKNLLASPCQFFYKMLHMEIWAGLHNTSYGGTI